HRPFALDLHRELERAGTLRDHLEHRSPPKPDHGGEYDPRRMPPLERLLNLVILLLETPRFLTFEQIRERLPAYSHGDDESAKRMFERDKDVLRDLGV